MTKIRIMLDLEYDSESMHGDDPEAIDWFFNSVLKSEDLVLHENEMIGDTIGTVSNIQILDWEKTLHLSGISKSSTA